MSYPITKIISVDFSALITAVPDGAELRTLIIEDITSAVLESIQISEDDDECIFTFDIEPSVGDQTVLTNIVSAHTGVVAHGKIFKGINVATFSQPGVGDLSSGVLTLNLLQHQKCKIVLDENVTSVVVTAPVEAGSFIVAIHQAPSGGPYTLPATVASWPATFEFVDDVAPVAPTGASQVILISVYFDGVTYRCIVSDPFNG